MKMKILVIAPTPFFSDRGTHIRILEEALAMERLGHQVTIVTYHIGSELPESLGTYIDVRRIRRLLFWYKKLEAGPDWQKLLLDLMLIRKAFYLARTWRPDIIHAHLHEGVAIGWVVQKTLFWRRIKLVADFHGSLTKEMASHAYLRLTWLRRIFRFLEHWIDNRGDAAVTSSWENTREIQDVRHRSHVQTLLDGVNLSYYRGLPNRNKAREKFGFSDKDVIVTYTGALIPNKGVRILIDAIPAVLESCPEARFVIAGYPRDQIEGVIADRPWSSRVTFVEPSPFPYFDLPCLLWASDIGVDPKDSSTSQASGKILQYMGASLPVACFDTVNNRKYLGEGGEYASEVSAQGLADAIISLVRDASLRERRGLANHRMAERFTWDRSAEQFSKICEHLLDDDKKQDGV